MKTRKNANPVLAILLLGLMCGLPLTTVMAQEPAEQPSTEQPAFEQPSNEQPPTQERTPQEPAAVPPQEPSVEMREDFSDNELKSFVKANEKVTVIQMEAEQKMVEAIEQEGLTVERFNEILEQQRDPSRASETSTEELQSFNNAAQAILAENERIEKEMVSSIEEEGIDIDTYKQIMLAYQHSADVQTRVNGLVNTDN